MKKIIHHIRKQPEKVKRHILHLLVIFFGVVLVSFWIYSLGTTLPDTKEISDDLKPFSALKDNIVGGYQSISQPELNLPENNY